MRNPGRLFGPRHNDRDTLEWNYEERFRNKHHCSFDIFAGVWRLPRKCAIRYAIVFNKIEGHVFNNPVAIDIGVHGGDLFYI